MVHEVASVEDYNEKIANAGEKLVIIDFHAKWCGPCKRISPFIDQLAEEFVNDVVFLKINVDEQDELTQKFNIEMMPTFVAIRNGENLDIYTGSDQAKLKAFVQSYIQK